MNSRAPAEQLDGWLAASLRVLADRGVLGVACLDESLIATDRFGRLAEVIPLGEPICDAVPCFTGLMPDLLALQDEPGGSFAIGNVGLISPFAVQKVSFELFWLVDEVQYCLIVHCLGSTSAPEYEIVRQLRARRIAEEHLRQAREELNEKQVLLDRVIDYAPAAIALFDHDMRRVFATRRWSDLFSRAAEPDCGQSELLGVRPDMVSGPLQTAAAGQTVLTDLRSYRQGEGGLEWIRSSHRPWLRESGAVGGIVSAAEVVTAAIAEREKLEARNVEVERRNSELDAFTATVSHELRAPLRTMEACIRAMRDCAPSERASGVPAQLDRMDIQIARLTRLLDDLSEHARIGHSAAPARAVDVPSLVREIVASIPAAAAFDVHCELSEPRILIEVAPFEIVLGNLIENAVRHHDRGRGKIRVTMTGTGEQFFFGVSDDGPGIDAQYHREIFEPFKKLPTSGSAVGSGLGLSLVVKALAGVGGTISVESRPHHARGTRFKFSWPRRDAPACAAPGLRGPMTDDKEAPQGRSYDGTQESAGASVS